MAPLRMTEYFRFGAVRIVVCFVVVIVVVLLLLLFSCCCCCCCLVLFLGFLVEFMQLDFAFLGILQFLGYCFA